MAPTGAQLQDHGSVRQPAEGESARPDESELEKSLKPLVFQAFSGDEVKHLGKFASDWGKEAEQNEDLAPCYDWSFHAKLLAPAAAMTLGLSQLCESRRHVSLG